MRYHNDEDLLVFSATDLNRLRDCGRANALEIDVAMGRRGRPERTPTDVYARAGLRHERQVLEEYIRTFGSEKVVIIDDPGRSPAERRSAAEKTLAAMQAGAEVIHQAVLWWDIDAHTAFFGLADFLLRQEDGNYQVIDTKLAKAMKPKYVVQIGMYADVLARMTGRDAVDPAILLGTHELIVTPFAQAEESATALMDQFLETLAPRRAAAITPPKAHKKPECGYCDFKPECQAIWQERGDLSLVAGIGPQTVEEYERYGYDSMRTLGAADEDDPPEGVGAQIWRTHVRQARLQAHAQPDRELPMQIIDPDVLERLAPPTPGDLYFDIEGYAIAPLRLEYLFGLWDGSEFIAMWAHSPAEEAQMLTDFIAEVTRRQALHPELRIYYYNHYEINALRRLAALHDRHHEQVERLCEEVMINLMPIVKKSIMAGVPGYGLKELERLHGFTRMGQIKTAGDSVDLYDQWLYDGQDPQLLEAIAAYNLEDLQSTQALHHWLSSLVKR